MENYFIQILILVISWAFLIKHGVLSVSPGLCTSGTSGADCWCSDGNCYDTHSGSCPSDNSKCPTGQSVVDHANVERVLFQYLLYIFL